MKNYNLKFKIFNFSLALLIFTFCLLPLKSVYADFSVGIYPPIIQIQANVPSIITKDITLVNANENPIDLSVSLKQFTQSPYNNGQVQYISDNIIQGPDKQIFDKVQLLDGDNPVSAVTLLPKQKKTFTMRIGLPKDEPPADYYFSFLFSSSATPKSDANGSSIQAAIASHVLLSIGPKDKATGFLDEFSSPWFVTSGPVPFTVLVNNTSNFFINPNGQILIRNMFGQLVGKVDLLSVNVLDKTSRYIPSSIINGQSSMVNVSGHPVALWNEKVLFGTYKATLTISLSPGGPVYRRDIYFLAIPIQYILGGALALVIVLFIIERVRNRMKNS